MPGLLSGGVLNNEYAKGRANVGLISIEMVIAKGKWFTRAANVTESSNLTPRLFERSSKNLVAKGATNSRIRWTSAASGLNRSPVCGDIDADKEIEIVTFSLNKVVCLRTDGTQKWATTVRNAYESYGGPTIYDIDQDGKMEILVPEGTYDFKESLVCLNSDGSIRWKYEISPIDYIEDSDASVYDIDGDGQLEILFCTTTYLYCLKPDGTLKWRYTDAKMLDMVTPPAVGDIDKDGDVEIVVAGSGAGGQVYAIKSDGTLDWIRSLARSIGASVAIADVDADGLMEVFTDSRDQNRFHCLNSDGSVRWTKVEGGWVMLYGILIGDIDKDGTVEIIYGTDAANRTYCILSDGTTVKWTRDAVTPRSYVGADIDGDGFLEILITSGDATGWIYCLEHDGSVKWARSPLPYVTFPPAVDDIDGDGKLEFIVSYQNYVRCYEVYE